MNKDFNEFVKLGNSGLLSDVISETLNATGQKEPPKDINFNLILMINLLHKYHQWLQSSNN